MSGLRSIAALYDIHGNLPALDAVVGELHADPPDAVVVGGDVAAGPMPREVLERLREVPWALHWLRGNADRTVVMGFDEQIPPELQDHPLFKGDAWAATFLSREDRDFLDSLPPLLALGVEGTGDVLFCHGTSRSDEERVTTATSSERLERILGPGVRLMRTPYDTASADAAFHALGYPAADLMVASVDPDAVAERFERASEQPVGRDSPIDPAANPLARRDGARATTPVAATRADR